MADIKIPPVAARADPAEAREEAIRQGIELLFFAYRDFTAEPDAILAQYGFGRAHHRVVHFVGRHPQMTVGDRRQRLLELTEEGRELERRLSEVQRARVAAAFRQAGAQAVEGFRQVLLGIIAEDGDRRRFGRARPPRR